jgi:penicillin-binding protein-related factor A (putative recombinase)
LPSINFNFLSNSYSYYLTIWSGCYFHWMASQNRVLKKICLISIECRTESHRTKSHGQKVTIFIICSFSIKKKVWLKKINLNIKYYVYKSLPSINFNFLSNSYSYYLTIWSGCYFHWMASQNRWLHSRGSSCILVTSCLD